MLIRNALRIIGLAWLLIAPLNALSQSAEEETSAQEFSLFPYGHDPLSCFVQNEAADLCSSEAGLFQMGRFALAVEALAKMLETEGLQYSSEDLQATILSDVKRHGADSTIIAPLMQSLYLSITEVGQETLTDPEAVRSLAIYGLEALYPSAFTGHGFAPEEALFDTNGKYASFGQFFDAIKDNASLHVNDLMPFRPKALSGSTPFVRLRGSGLPLSGSPGPENLRFNSVNAQVGIQPEHELWIDAPISAIFADALMIEGIGVAGNLSDEGRLTLLNDLCSYCKLFISGKDPSDYSRAELFEAGAFGMIALAQSLDDVNMLAYSGSFTESTKSQNEGATQIWKGSAKIGIGIIAGVGALATAPEPVSTLLLGSTAVGGIVSGMKDLAQGTQKIIEGQGNGAGDDGADTGTSACDPSVCTDTKTSKDAGDQSPENTDTNANDGSTGYAVDPDDDWPGEGYDINETCDPTVNTVGGSSMCPCRNASLNGGDNSKGACEGLNQPNYLVCFMNSSGAAKCDPSNVFGPGVANGDAVYFLTQDGELTEVSGDTRLVTVGDLARASEINAFQQESFRSPIEVSLLGYILEGEDVAINPGLISEEFFEMPEDGIQFTPPENFELTPDFSELLREQ